MHLFASHLNWVLATALSSPLPLLRTPLSSSSLLPSFLSTLISGSYMPALHQANSVHYKCYPKVFLKSNKVFCKLHFPDIFPQPGSVETRLSTHDTNTQLAQINVFSRGFMYFPKLNPHAFPNAHVWDALNGHAPTSPCPRVGWAGGGHQRSPTTDGNHVYHIKCLLQARALYLGQDLSRVFQVSSLFSFLSLI